MRFSLPLMKCSAAPTSFRLYCLNCAQRFDHHLITARSTIVGSLEEPPNTDLIDGSEKRICRLTFEFKSPHDTERRSKGIILCNIKMVFLLHYTRNA